MKYEAQQITFFVNLSGNVMVWKLTWSQTEEIDNTRVYNTYSSEGAAGAAKWALFCIIELSNVYPLDIPISIY